MGKCISNTFANKFLAQVARDLEEIRWSILKNQDIRHLLRKLKI